MSEENTIETSTEEIESSESSAEETTEVEGSNLDGAPEIEPEKETLEEKVKKWVLKVDGKDVEIENEEELIKRAQMGFSADKKWQEAASMRKQLEDFVNLLMTDTEQGLSMLGIDVDDFTEKRAEKILQELEKTPEQKQQDKVQKELEDARNKLKKVEEEKKQAELLRMQQMYAKQFDEQISGAINDSGFLPKSPYVVKRLADTWHYVLKNVNSKATIDQILPIVEGDIVKEFNQMFSGMPEEKIERVVGKDVLSKMRQKRVEDMKKKQVASVKQIQETKKPQTKKKPAEKVSTRDFFKKLGTL